MTDPATPDVTAQIAALEGRVTAIEQGLSAAIAQFTPIGERVAELSSAFLAANERLAGLESAVIALVAAQPAPNEDRLTALEEGQERLDTRISAVEQARARGGRLSSRLINIEDTLKSLVDAQGGTE